MNRRCLSIAIAVPRLAVGGLETVLKSLAGYLISAGHSATFVETHSKGPWSDEFRALGHSVVTMAAPRFGSALLHARNVGRQLSKHDVVLVNDAPYAQSALGFMRQASVAIPVLHLPIRSCRQNATGNSREWEVLVAVSPGMRDALIGMDSVPADRVICIPNGVSVAAEWPKRDTDFGATAPLRVIFVGRVEDQQKGVMHLPGIARRARARGAQIEMSVVGDGPDLNALRREFFVQCRDCPVTFHGAKRHPEVAELLSRHDVIVMPSYFEGLPIALLEAMAAGVVPVVSRLRGQTDLVVTNGENGHLVDVGEEEGFAAALEASAKNRSELSRLSAGAWRTVKERFAVEAMGQAYESAIEFGLARRASSASACRSGRVDSALLGDLAWLPCSMVRPVRKGLRLAGLWPRVEAMPASMREWEAESGPGRELRPRHGSGNP